MRDVRSRVARVWRTRGGVCATRVWGGLGGSCEDGLAENAVDRHRQWKQLQSRETQLQIVEQRSKLRLHQLRSVKVNLWVPGLLWLGLGLVQAVLKRGLKQLSTVPAMRARHSEELEAIQRDVIVAQACYILHTMLHSTPPCSIPLDTVYIDTPHLHCTPPLHTPLHSSHDACMSPHDQVEGAAHEAAQLEDVERIRVAGAHFCAFGAAALDDSCLQAR